MKFRGKFVAAAAALALLAAVLPASADIVNSQMPPPGALDYVEGQVSVQGQMQSPKDVGSDYLQANQVLNTGKGYAELLLTPGVYLRVGHHSEVRMISPDLANTQVQLMSGQAMVEVDELFKQNDIGVTVDNARTTIEKTGLYAFAANPATAAVLDGKAEVSEGDQHVELKKNHEVPLAAGEKLKAQHLNKHAVENDPLYRWSKLRSEYATRANVDMGYTLAADGGWSGAGWYWDPFYLNFAFMPGGGMFWGPFGYPFFSPAFVGYAPYYGFFARPGRFYHYQASSGRAGVADPPLARHAGAGEPGFRPAPRPLGPRAGFGGHAMPMLRGGFHRSFMAAPRGGLAVNRFFGHSGVGHRG